jgi:hypothetical protein
MKADVRTEAEKDALQWAVDYFRRCAADLKPGRHGMEEAARGLLLNYDRNRADAEKEISDSLLAAWLGHKEASQYMREFAAVLMERERDRAAELPGNLFHFVLPENLAHFVVEFLRNPDKPRLTRDDSDPEYLAWEDRLRLLITRKPGPRSGDMTSRNVTIWAAMEHIVKTWKFPATRNEATKGKRASAASIVREALKKGAGVHLSEAAVVKAWNKMRLPGEQALALDSRALEK